MSYPDSLSCLLNRQSLESEEREELLGNTNAGGTSAKEQDSLVGHGGTSRGGREAGSIEETRENDGA